MENNSQDDNREDDKPSATVATKTTNLQNRARAFDRALIASRVLDPKIFPSILTAIEEKDSTTFISICETVGIDGTMAKQMWRATMASRRSQSFTPCW